MTTGLLFGFLCVYMAFVMINITLENERRERRRKELVRAFPPRRVALWETPEPKEKPTLRIVK